MCAQRAGAGGNWGCDVEKSRFPSGRRAASPPAPPHRHIMAEPIEVKDGRIAAKGPGLGMVWDERAVARYAV